MEYKLQRSTSMLLLLAPISNTGKISSILAKYLQYVYAKSSSCQNNILFNILQHTSRKFLDQYFSLIQRVEELLKRWFNSGWRTRRTTVLYVFSFRSFITQYKTQQWFLPRHQSNSSTAASGRPRDWFHSSLGHAVFVSRWPQTVGKCKGLLSGRETYRLLDNWNWFENRGWPASFF